MTKQNEIKTNVVKQLNTIGTQAVILTMNVSNAIDTINAIGLAHIDSELAIGKIDEVINTLVKQKEALTVAAWGFYGVQ
jgi:hypothetical protein